MRKNRTARIAISRVDRWAAVLLVVLSVLSAQQSWAAIACHCESHGKLAPQASHCGLHKDEPPDTHSVHSVGSSWEVPDGETHHSAHDYEVSDRLPDSAETHSAGTHEVRNGQEGTETHHSGHHRGASNWSPEPAETHSARNYEVADLAESADTHHSDHHNAASDSFDATGSAATATDSTSGAGYSPSRSISCCCFAPSSAAPALVTLPTQQPIPVEDAPAVVASSALATTASASTPSPPGLATSRPLYIVQSSLLI